MPITPFGWQDYPLLTTEITAANLEAMLSHAGAYTDTQFALTLKATNNLSDVSNTATALANLGGAPLNSPAFTGVPTAPTASLGTNTTQLATTAFVLANAGAVLSVFGRTGAVTAQSGDYTAAQVSNAADKASASQQAFTGEVKAPDFAAGGLTGATSASRYVGATTSGHPASGTFVVGDYVVDQSGFMWICTTAGSPGTWTQVGGGGNTLAGDTDVSFASLSAGQGIVYNASTSKWNNGLPSAANVNTVAASGSGTVTIPDPWSSPFQTINDVTLTGNPTFAFPTAASGKGFTLILHQDATGSRTVTWPNTVIWLSSQGAPTLSSPPSSVNSLSFVCTDGTHWLGSFYAANAPALQPSRAYRNASFSFTNAVFTKVPLDTVAFDPIGAMDVTTNHRYNVPVAGWYLVTGQVEVGVASGEYLAVIYKNGAIVSRGNDVATSSGYGSTTTDIIQCNAGDYLELWFYCGAGATSLSVTAPTTTNFLSVTPLTTPAGAATAPNVARAYRNAALSLSANATVKVPIDTITFDPANNMDVTTNHRYNVPVSGWYHVNGEVNCTTNTVLQVYIYKNGVSTIGGDAPSTAYASGVSDIVFCNAGDYLELWCFSNGTPAIQTAAPGVLNYLSVSQVQAPGAQSSTIALPAGATYQNGVINSGDGLISAISITGGTGALAFTLAAANPCIVKDATGKLDPVPYLGGTYSITPSTLPTNGNSIVMGVEMDTNGLIYITPGSSVAGTQSTASTLETNTPAVTSGRMRVADIGVYNSAGTYQFSNNSATATQGTNWVDRRPWARGFNDSMTGSQTGTDYTSTSTTLVAMDSTHLAARLECTGVPVLFCVSLSTYLTTASDGIYIALMMDGVLVNGTQQQENTGTTSLLNTITASFTPSAGSHLFQLGYAAQVAAQQVNVVNRAASNLLGYPVMTLREIVAQTSNNGTT